MFLLRFTKSGGGCVCVCGGKGDHDNLGKGKATKARLPITYPQKEPDGWPEHAQRPPRHPAEEPRLSPFHPQGRDQPPNRCEAAVRLGARSRRQTSSQFVVKKMKPGASTTPSVAALWMDGEKER